MAAPAQDLVYKGPEFDNSQFYGAFWAFDNGSKLDAGFDALKTLLGQGGDFLKEAASVLKERAQIEEQYAKSLEKLKAKAEKVGDNTYGYVSGAAVRREYHIMSPCMDPSRTRGADC
eukprot:m.147397 g.147397  ORF g.147397 m.147397 type:complete len:117 (-) comp16259_c0_seq6:1709-2059(-)